MVTKEKKVKKEKKASDKAIEAAADAKKNTPMGRMIAESVMPPSVGDIVEGPVITIEKSAVYIDLPPYGTGLIYGREYIIARDVIKKINIGDRVAAKVVDAGNENGYVELSLKEARTAAIWTEAEQAIAEKKVFDLPIKEANKGGLIVEWQGIVGFLPASQLKTEHYPRVPDGDKDRILEELKKLVNTRLELTIIGALPKEGKLIFSEKGTENKEKVEMTSTYKVGDDIEGVVTGIVDFGAFVKIAEGLEGLVHISEIDWGLVEDPKLFLKIGEKVKVRIIEIKDGKISLSLKALKQNPWKEAASKYKKDVAVRGVIIKFNKHGALASIEEGVAGLVHVSDFGSEEKLRAHLELGKVYPFKITLFDPANQKMTLSYAGERK